MEDQCVLPIRILENARMKARQAMGRHSSLPHSDQTERLEEGEGLDILPPDCLEAVACLLDTPSALALLRTSRELYTKLTSCPHFWKHLVHNECFEKYSSLKKEDSEDGEERRSWSGEVFHDRHFPEEATHWQRIFQRGISMRRNLVEGRYEMWRMFMTGAEHMPVKKMTSETSFRELRSAHRGSPYVEGRRRVRINRYWNEDYLVVLQHDSQHNFNDIFVWAWKECQQPRFLYSKDMMPLYPTGLFPTAFFLYKQFLVLMPDTAGISSTSTFTSMIRVHDLTSDLALVGSYSLPENSSARRVKEAHGMSEAAHLHRMGDRAVALCRTPTLTLYIFSLPDCQLQLCLPLHTRPQLGILDGDDMDQRYLVRDNRMMFFFHDKEFFSHLFTPEEADLVQERYGRLLQLDFDAFIKTGGPVVARVDAQFDKNQDYVEKIQLVTGDRMVCGLASGRIVVREVVEGAKPGLLLTREVLGLPCPEPLQEEWDDATEEEVETDGPTVCSSKTGDRIVAMRHFTSGRRVHAYNGTGALLYTINIDSDQYNLESRPGYLSIDMDGRFLCATDQEKMVVWDSLTGRHVRTITLSRHYSIKVDPGEEEDRYCWKGHTDFAFTEDGIIIIHSQRNAPVAADVFLFW